MSGFGRLVFFDKLMFWVFRSKAGIFFLKVLLPILFILAIFIKGTSPAVVNEKIERIRNKQHSTVYFRNLEPINDVVIITATEKYLFLWSDNAKRSYVIPLTNVINIAIQSPDPKAIEWAKELKNKLKNVVDKDIDTLKRFVTPSKK